MLDALKFVERATADKDIIRALTHICIHDGRLQGADSKMALECACPELTGQSFTVPADKFIRAVTACDNDPTIELLEDKRVKISHKRFKVTLPTLKVEDYPRAELTGEALTVPDGFIAALRRLFPFISQDASRPWSLGVWLDGQYAYATNNVILVRTPLAWIGTPINIPRYAVQEIIEIAKPIKQLWMSTNAIGIEYDDAWFRAQKYVDEWPANVTGLFARMCDTMQVVPDGLLEAVNKLIPFCPDVKIPTIYFQHGAIATANGAQSAEIGFDWEGVGVYRAEVLQLVLGVAKEWDPTTYPAPCFFRGDKLEGLLVGVRV